MSSDPKTNGNRSPVFPHRPGPKSYDRWAGSWIRLQGRRGQLEVLLYKASTCWSNQTAAIGIEEIECLLDLLDLVTRYTSSFVVLRAEGGVFDLRVAGVDD